MKRTQGIIKTYSNKEDSNWPYGRPASGKDRGKRAPSTISHYKRTTVVQTIRVGPRAVNGVRRPISGHHIDIRKAPIYYERNGKKVGIPRGKKERRGEKK